MCEILEVDLNEKTTAACVLNIKQGSLYARSSQSGDSPVFYPFLIENLLDANVSEW